jgi:hypothetical protein
MINKQFRLFICILIPGRCQGLSSGRPFKQPATERKDNESCDEFPDLLPLAVDVVQTLGGRIPGIWL